MGWHTTSWARLGFGSESVLKEETVKWPAGVKQSHITSKRYTKIRFWKHFEQDICSVGPESWFIVDQSCLVCTGWSEFGETPHSTRDGERECAGAHTQEPMTIFVTVDARLWNVEEQSVTDACMVNVQIDEVRKDLELQTEPHLLFSSLSPVWETCQQQSSWYISAHNSWAPCLQHLHFLPVAWILN